MSRRRRPAPWSCYTLAADLSPNRLPPSHPWPVGLVGGSPRCPAAPLPRCPQLGLGPNAPSLAVKAQALDSTLQGSAATLLGELAQICQGRCNSSSGPANLFAQSSPATMQSRRHHIGFWVLAMRLGLALGWGCRRNRDCSTLCRMFSSLAKVIFLEQSSVLRAVCK